MARPYPIEYPGAFYHVISRGNARLPIFILMGIVVHFSISYSKLSIDISGIAMHMPNGHFGT